MSFYTPPFLLSCPKNAQEAWLRGKIKGLSSQNGKRAKETVCSSIRITIRQYYFYIGKDHFKEGYMPIRLLTV